jgi:hypothetical protein
MNMNAKRFTWPRLLLGLAAVALLAAASYVAVSLIFTGSLGLGGSGSRHGHGYQVIQPTELPQRMPDIVGPVVEVKDQSFIVQSHSKGRVDPNGPRTEIVIAAGTQVLQDITNRDASSVVNGKLQQRAAPYTYNLIKVGDVLSVWGSQRGDRLVADDVMVEVNTAAPTP